MLIGCLTAIAISMVLLYAGSTPDDSDRMLTLTGLGALTASLILWWATYGPEFGSVYWLINTALLAWALIFLVPLRNAKTSARTTKTEQRAERADSATHSPAQAELPHHRRTWRRVGLSLLGGPLALITSALVCLAAARWLPFDTSSRWIIAAFCLPLVWAVQLIQVSGKTPRRALVTSCVFSALGLVGIAV